MAIPNDYKTIKAWQNPDSSGDENGSILGSGDGFVITSNYVPSKGVRLTKEDVYRYWDQFVSRPDFSNMRYDHRMDLPPIGIIRETKYTGQYNRTATSRTDRRA